MTIIKGGIPCTKKMGVLNPGELEAREAIRTQQHPPDMEVYISAPVVPLYRPLYVDV